MINQFGQHIEVGDWVGWVSKTGSYTDRRVGKVLRFGERDAGYGHKETTVIVHWLLDGAHGDIATACNFIGNGVGINRVLKLDPADYADIPPF